MAIGKTHLTLNKNCVHKPVDDNAHAPVCTLVLRTKRTWNIEFAANQIKSVSTALSNSTVVRVLPMVNWAKIRLGGIGTTTIRKAHTTLYFDINTTFVFHNEKPII